MNPTGSFASSVVDIFYHISSMLLSALPPPTIGDFLRTALVSSERQLLCQLAA
jgi:hypothetical protein